MSRLPQLTGEEMIDSFRSRHKCQRILTAWPMAEGRDVWLGKILEPDEVYPLETHCLHVKTPENDFVLGLNMGDAAIMAALAQVIHGIPINQRYLDWSIGRMLMKGSEREN